MRFAYPLPAPSQPWWPILSLSLSLHNPSPARHRWPIIPVPVMGLPGLCSPFSPPCCLVLVFPILAALAGCAIILAVLIPVTPPAVALIPRHLLTSLPSPSFLSGPGSCCSCCPCRCCCYCPCLVLVIFVFVFLAVIALGIWSSVSLCPSCPLVLALCFVVFVFVVVVVFLGLFVCCWCWALSLSWWHDLGSLSCWWASLHHLGVVAAAFPVREVVG
jgi:hypothetical protein